MATHGVTISARHDLSVADVEQLEDHLYDHNRGAIGRDDGRRLAFMARDTDGRQIGAIAGYTWAGMAEIKQLWVDEAHRSMGTGRQLLEAGIREAIERRCQCIRVLSYEFQVRDCMRKAASSGLLS